MFLGQLRQMSEIYKCYRPDSIKMSILTRDGPQKEVDGIRMIWGKRKRKGLHF